MGIRVGEHNIMGFILAILVVMIVIKSFYYPDTNSTASRLGKGCGNKTRQFGEWLTKDG